MHNHFQKSKPQPMHWLAALFGVFSLLTALLMTLSSQWSIWWLSRPGVLITEQPWIPMLSGSLALRFGKRATRAVGLIGLALGSRPLWQVRNTSRRHDRALRDGFGRGYDEYLQQNPLTAQATNSRLDLIGSALKRRTAPKIDELRDLAYFTDHHQQCTLFLDVYQPAIASTVARPAIISIHGGGWNGGDKGGFFVEHNRQWAALGYVVFDIQYRLSPDVLWPTHLVDVKMAIRWVRANAGRFKVDARRLALIGRSAGAHLALMAAFSSGDPQFSGADNADQAEDVQAVIAVYPPTDLPLLQQTVRDDLNYWLGKTLADAPTLYREASPYYVAKSSAPPILLAHGGRDNLVPPEQSSRLQARLRDLGVPCAYLYYPWSRHGLDVSLAGLGGHMLQYDSERFLCWALR